jgi:hypothetical protein
VFPRPIGWDFERDLDAFGGNKNGESASSSDRILHPNRMYRPILRQSHILQWDVGIFRKQTLHSFRRRGQKGSRLYKTQKNLVFCPTTKRLEACGTMRPDISQVRSISCPESEVMHAASYTINEWFVSESLVPFGQARPFQGGCDRSGGVE